MFLFRPSRGDDRFNEAWEELFTLMGEVPVSAVANKARSMFAGLEDDPVQRAAFRDRLRFAAQCLRQSPRTANDVREMQDLFRTGMLIRDEATGEDLPLELDPAEADRGIDEVLSESRSDVAKAEAADALADMFDDTKK